MLFSECGEKIGLFLNPVVDCAVEDFYRLKIYNIKLNEQFWLNV